ncbi:hypothetical protein [Mycobacteroides chelonae]|nr:hypothetical protein [Mycobacteroides chelonae]
MAKQWIGFDRARGELAQWTRRALGRRRGATAGARVPMLEGFHA